MLYYTLNIAVSNFERFHVAETQSFPTRKMLTIKFYIPVWVIKWDIYLRKFSGCKIVTVIDAGFEGIERADSVEHSTYDKGVSNFIFLK